MANQAAKEASTRQRKARLIYIPFAILINLLYILGRYVLWSNPIEIFSIGEIVGLIFYGFLWYYAVQTLISSVGIGSTRNKDDLDLDKFEPLVLAILIMILQIYSSSNYSYYLSLLIPLKIVYGLLAGMRNLTLNKAAQQAQSAEQEKALAAAEKAAEKKDRQLQRGSGGKQRVFTR